jgi:hypothetical protein
MFGVLLICNTLLTLFLVGIVLETRQELNNIDTILATKNDLINLKQASMENVLEKNCSRCHAESRFAEYHGSEQDLIRMIKDMQKMEGSPVDPDDIDKIHASLELLQCNACHEQERIRTMTLKSDEERNEIIRAMLERSAVNTDEEDIARIKRSYQQIYGF